MHRLPLFFLILFSVLLSGAASAKDVKDVDPVSFQKMEKSSLLIVDVRTPEEYAEGHVPGAVNIPLGTIQNDISMFEDKDKPILMYCRSGKRAGKALDILQQNGFSDLYHLDGDMQGWIKADMPVAMPAKTQASQ